MSREWSESEEELTDLLRSQDFDTDGPVRMDIGTHRGSVVVELGETAVTHVEVRHATSAAGQDWQNGLSGLLSWVSEQFGTAAQAGGRGGFDLGNLPQAPITEVVRRTRIDLSGNRLVVRAPTNGPLRGVPLAVRVTAPVGSEVGVQTGSAEVSVSGAAGKVSVQGGTGTVSVEEATDRATVRSGSGPVRLGSMRGGVHARSGRGDIEVGAIGAPSSVVNGSGAIWLGEVSADVLVRTGSGDITVADAVDGQVELISGSGELQVSVHRGTAAEVDLTSTTGTARSELDVAEQPPEAEPTLRVFGRTGSGDAVLTTAG
ncbi:hypothetical protein EIL87_13735 [Saccharopolyspora rhizosphaerae]|uniref:Uncharacterized protein n=1 Tax=Saccharopolyspora rhizosphaerae TaxID=2492662 RepID=A0A426JT55_9PSEU|nr:hypothetical protein EIL87_13735 [Saccharopolyspora rhizosphaerae]